MARTILKVKSRNLAFFETLCDIEPIRYLKAGEKVELISSTAVYGGVHGDKEYLKVSSPSYGVGYMLSDGLEEVNHAGA